MLYTERYGIRKPTKKTYEINLEQYYIILKCCDNYKENLIHIYSKKAYCDFLGKEYIEFDNKHFLTSLKIFIPELYRGENGEITTPNEDEKYNQYALLDYIEYIAKNIQDIEKKWNNEIYKNYEIITSYKSSNIFKNFKLEINEIFEKAGLLYKLTDKKIIERVPLNMPFNLKMENICKSAPEIGVKKLLEDAIALYKTPDPKTRQDSIEKLWDALERLKTYYKELDKKSSMNNLLKVISNNNNNFLELFDNEFKVLTNIGNNYRIRHHETNKIEITDMRYYDYLFNRCVSLIALSIQFLNE